MRSGPASLQAAVGLIVKSQANRQIAQELLISMATTKIYVKHIIEKLEVSDRARRRSRPSS
jgi:DNA-binding NarL/FixJ family response regulator